LRHCAKGCHHDKWCCLANGALSVTYEIRSPANQALDLSRFGTEEAPTWALHESPRFTGHRYLGSWGSKTEIELVQIPGTNQGAPKESHLLRDGLPKGDEILAAVTATRNPLLCR
jgi:hypothetical protein